MTRRPGSDPDLLVSSVDRDTWQGMANARVPSAFPIDRFRVPDPQRRPPAALISDPSQWTQYYRAVGISSGAPPSPWNALADGWVSGDRTHENLAGKNVLWLLAASAVADMNVGSGWTVIGEGRLNNLCWLVAHAPWSASLDTVVTSTPSGNYGAIRSRLIVADVAGGWNVEEKARRAGPGGTNNLTLVQPTGRYRFQIIFASSAYAHNWVIGPPTRFGVMCMGNLSAACNTWPPAPDSGWGPIDSAYEAVCDEGDYSHSSIGAYGTPTSVTFNANWGAG